jgi:hypothetical protein
VVVTVTVTVIAAPLMATDAGTAQLTSTDTLMQLSATFPL